MNGTESNDRSLSESPLSLRLRSARAFVALGANIGDRRAALNQAVGAMNALPGTGVERVSTWYDTAPVGGPEGQPRFLNGVARLSTRLGPRALLDALLRIETEAGRDRSVAVTDGPRLLDLDLLLYEGETSDDEHLRLPHPRMEERDFVLRPLAEIEPSLILPVSRRSALQRLNELAEC